MGHHVPTGAVARRVLPVYLVMDIFKPHDRRLGDPQQMNQSHNALPCYQQGFVLRHRIRVSIVLHSGINGSR